RRRIDGVLRAGDQIDLGHVVEYGLGELHLPARREREIDRGLRSGVLVGGRRPAPAAADRLLAGERSGPAVTDRIAALEVVHVRRHRAFLELAGGDEVLATTR